jgi:ABC-type sugar transport system permease subunit
MSLIMQFNQSASTCSRRRPRFGQARRAGGNRPVITYIFNTAFKYGSYAKAAAYSVISSSLSARSRSLP